MSILLRDLIPAWRHARRRPLVSSAVVLTLAIAIGAVTGAIGLATAVLWRPLPLSEPSRVMLVWEQAGEDGVVEPFRVTSGRYAAWRDRGTGFASLALFGAAGFSMESADGVTSVRGVRVSGRYFWRLLGLAPIPAARLVRMTRFPDVIGWSCCRTGCGSSSASADAPMPWASRCG
ncbi:MAG: hypothetical protein R2712_19255 [Vicinamibacterales bacterium]